LLDVDMFICLQGVDFVGWEFDTVRARRGRRQLEQLDRGSNICVSVMKRHFRFAATEERMEGEVKEGWVDGVTSNGMTDGVHT
jgi:hypothetical protein